ncbi:MAG: hypothetical protein COW22_05695 [Chloroflexi bacterium CG15_BIG_FIL_POST_REV_8_21_14_020_46_15]|nr:MAG: hypothetical protein COW22_05695 [Chloroflexi bacterium CG15_BIG_FIL_POST_REV_8_21_14_020_46_15]
MEEMVLDLISSYENRICVVEKLVTTADSDESLSELGKETEKLKTTLRETLVNNCSLRRKDFNKLMERMLSDFEKDKKKIEEEQQQVRDKVKGYLSEQKELAASLREKLARFATDAEKDSLKAAIQEFKTACQDKAEQVFVLLRDFQSRLDVFQREQEEVNHKLQRLVDRGETLRIEDLRQVEAAKACQDRKAERELRREDIERLLTHFRQQRRRNS